MYTSWLPHIVTSVYRAARFLADLPVTFFFGFLEVCMSGPEEDLAQGGRFLMWPQRFIDFFNINLLSIDF